MNIYYSLKQQINILRFYFIIYKYCREDNMYHELDKSAPEYKYILSHLWGFVSSEPIEENK